MSLIKSTDTYLEDMKKVEEQLIKEEDKIDELHKKNTETIHKVTGGITTIDDALDYTNSKYGGSSGKKV